MISARLTLAAAAGVLLAAGPLLAQDSKAEKHLLRYSFKKGSTGHYVVTSGVDMSMDMGGQSMDNAMTMQMFLSFDVADVVDGLAQVDHKLTRMKMSGNMGPMQKIEFDTADEDSVPNMFDRYLDMIGQTIHANIDTQGKMKVELPDELQKNAGGPVAFNPEMLNQFITALPTDAVAVGDTWTTTMSNALGQMGQMEMTVTNKLVAFDGKTATIEQQLEMNTEDLPMGEAELKKAVGTLVLDLDDCMPRETNMDMEMDMKMSQGGQDMSMEMKMNSSMKRTAAPMDAKDSKDAKPTSRKSPDGKNTDGKNTDK